MKKNIFTLSMLAFFQAMTGEGRADEPLPLTQETTTAPAPMPQSSLPSPTDSSTANEIPPPPQGGIDLDSKVASEIGVALEGPLLPQGTSIEREGASCEIYLVNNGRALFQQSLKIPIPLNDAKNDPGRFCETQSAKLPSPVTGFQIGRWSDGSRFDAGGSRKFPQ